MASAESDLATRRTLRIDSDALPESDRLARVRQAYAYAIADVDIAPRGASPFRWRGAVRRLPGLALAATVCSGVRMVRRPAPADADDLILTVTVEGRASFRHDGREIVAQPGEIVVTRMRAAVTAECDPQTRLFELRLPGDVLVPTIGGVDAILMSPIAAPEPLSMLLKYADVLLDTSGLEQPETVSLAVAHVHEIVSLMFDTALDATVNDKGRGPGAARLRAIKADIVENVCSRDLTIISIAERHRVTPRYVRKLFEGQGVTFSEFVLDQRLGRARRMLVDPRSDGETISAIAFACGFGDLSYFNRAFRRRFRATPTEVRETARLGGARECAGPAESGCTAAN
jgi:AraC-like DNA-binding protein